MKSLLSFLFLALAAFAQPASARDESTTQINAAMNVTPLRLEIPTDSVATKFLVRNRAEAPLDVQIRVFTWTQVNGEDRYENTQEIVISPSIITIAPENAQTFHVVSNSGRVTNSEKRYRVVIDELPGPFKAEAGVAQTTIRLTVPLFVDRKANQPPRIEVAANDGVLRIVNAGRQTARLTNIDVSSGGEPVPLSHNDRSRYIHGSNWVDLPLPEGATCSGKSLRVVAIVDNEPFDATAQQVCS